MTNPDQTVERYVKLFESLSPQTLPQLAELCTKDLHFCDPFNDVCGIEQTVHIFRHMFENTQNPVFTVYEWQRSGQIAFMFWNFRCRSFGRQLAFDGVSRIKVNHSGLITEHVDYWDSGEAVLRKIPLLGRLIGLAQRRISATSEKA